MDPVAIRELFSDMLSEYSLEVSGRGVDSLAKQWRDRLEKALTDDKIANLVHCSKCNLVLSYRCMNVTCNLMPWHPINARLGDNVCDDSKQSPLPGPYA
jgi:hypothetical protein